MGVKVYTVVPTDTVLIVAGLHVPLILLVEVVNNAGAVEFWHNGPIGAKVGTVSAVIVIFIVAGDEQPLPEGVKV